MKYFKGLLDKFGIDKSECLPLWKIIEKMSKDDMRGLVYYIDCCIDNEVEVKYFAQEACLFYAYWWRNNYNGGRGGHTYNNAPRDLGLRHKTERDITLLSNAVAYELGQLQYLGIPLLRRTNTQWLDSVFAQGGIPIQWLQNGDGVDQLTGFLKSLVLYYKNDDIPDWTDMSEAISIAENRGMPFFTQSEAFCGACLYYVKAIVENDDTNTDTDISILKNLLNRVKRETANYHESKDRFIVDWFLKVQNDKAELVYSLNAPEKLPISDDNNFYSRRYYLNDNYIADYVRHKESFTRQRNTNLPRFKPFKDGDGFFLQYIEENQGHPHPVNIVNGISPTFDEPILLSYSEGIYWGFGNKKDSPKAVFYPSNWKPEFSVTTKKIEFNGCDYFFAPIEPSLDLSFSDEDGNVFTLKDQAQQYYLNVRFPSLDWIEKSSHILVSQEVDIKKHLSIIDESGDIVRRGWSLEFRSANGFSEYRSNSDLNWGEHVLRVKLPDGRSRYLKIFIIDDITVKKQAQSNAIEFISKMSIRAMTPKVCRNGNIFSLNEMEERNCFSFRLSANGSYADVDVALPQCSSFWDISTGQRLPNKAIISISQLHRYKVYQSGDEKLCIKMTEEDEIRERTLVSTTMQWATDERYNLSYIGGEIEKITALHPLSRSKKLQLLIGRNCVKIREGSYSIYSNKDDHSLILKHNELECCEDIPIGIVRTDNILTSPIEEQVFKHDGTGVYHIPTDLTEFIVYSTYPEKSFTPQLIDFSENYVHKEYKIENRNLRKEESILDWDNYLCNKEGISDSVWKLWDIIRRNQLNYNTFNAFVALAEQPKLLALFITQIRQKYSNINLTETAIELERMEKELGFAYHTIPTECWQDVIRDMNSQYHITIQQLNGIPGIDINSITKEDFINSNCELYFQLLQRQFGDEYAQIINVYHIFNLPLTQMECRREQEYAAMISGMYISENATVKIPKDIKLLERYIVKPFSPLSGCEKLVQKMRFFAIAIPQYAARNAQTLNPDFWNRTESNSFVRRMINYIRQYAPDVYRELFCAVLLSQEQK